MQLIRDVTVPFFFLPDTDSNNPTCAVADTEY